jgi:hypothetical protein
MPVRVVQQVETFATGMGTLQAPDRTAYVVELEPKLTCRFAGPRAAAARASSGVRSASRGPLPNSSLVKPCTSRDMGRLIVHVYERIGPHGHQDR